MKDHGVENDHGAENDQVQPVEKWKVLDKRPRDQLVPVEEGVENRLAKAFRVGNIVVSGGGEGGGIERGHGGADEGCCCGAVYILLLLSK